MTATTAAPLASLAQQIARQQAELETLQREYEARQTNLADLNRRKEELQTQLQQIEADIRATTQGRLPLPALPAKNRMSAKPAGRRTQPKAPAKSAVPAPSPGSPRPHTLAALLLDIVQHAPGPITVKQLAQEVVRRKFPTTSRNIPAMVETRGHDLVRRGLLRRASGQPGFVPASSGDRGPLGKATPAAKPSPKNGAVVAQKTPAARSGGQKQQLPLRVVVTNLLAKNRKPLTARELADLVLASGYQTKSKNFIDVMWVALGQLDNIVNVPGKGYTLRK